MVISLVYVSEVVSANAYVNASVVAVAISRVFLNVRRVAISAIASGIFVCGCPFLASLSLVLSLALSPGAVPSVVLAPGSTSPSALAGVLMLE